MGLSLSVQIMRGGQPLGQHVFDSDTHRTIKIGRLTTAQIKLEDPKCSRIHAVIEFAGVDASLIDMGSTQGTLVNGAKVNKVKLSHGDQVTVGDTVLTLGFGAQAAVMAAPPAAAAAAPVVAPVVAPAKTPSAVAVPLGMRPMAFAGAPAAVSGDARQPTFDPTPATAPQEPVKRLTQERLRSAAVDSRPHPGITAEDELSAANRMLELRFYWGEVLLGMWHYDKPKRVTIGENNRTNIFLSSEGLPVEEFPLIRYKDNEYVLTVTGQMEGEVEVGGESHSIKTARGSEWARKDEGLEDAYQIKMAPDTRSLVHWGGATFAMRFVPPPKLTKESSFKSLDLPYINAIIFALFSHIALIVTLSVYPHDTDALKVDLFGEPDRFASLILEAPKENKSTKDMLEKIKKSVEEKKESIKPPEEKKKPPLDVAKNIPRNIPPPKKTVEEKKQEVAKRFSKLFAGGGNSLLGGGGGGSLAGTLQGVIGTAGTGSGGAGLSGLGIRGSAPIIGGGIGTSRGIAGIGTIGRLGGGGAGAVYGSGVGLGAAHERSVIGIETPTIEGALAPELIKKVINENKNQVRYCYEVELQRNQNLEGRVMVRWVISATGAVAQVLIKDSTIKNANVENCLLGKIKGWKFPPPAGGGTVEVNYPFVFKAS